MIDYEKSAELNGMEVEELKAHFRRFSKSGKRIIRICDSCKENRELYFCDYRPLCRKCSHNTPKSLKAHSDATTKYFTNQCARDRLSEIMKLFHKEHPEWGNSHSEWMIEYCKDPEVRKLMSIRAIERLSDQLVRDKISKSMRGGNDIVNHHFIYDHDHPENHTVEITRSQHTAHHHWMRRNGLEVPHLNVTEENKDVFR